MRILQISPQIPVPPSDGGKLSIFGITKHLSLRGHLVDFVCYQKHDDPNKALHILKQYSNPTVLDVQTDNSTIGAIFNLFSKIPYNSSKYIKPELSKFLKDYFKNNSPDIVHIDHLHVGWVVDLIRQLTDIPVVLRQQNLEMLIMKRFYEQEKRYLFKAYSKLQYSKLYKYESDLCQKFDKCIMISQEDEKVLRGINEKVNSTTISVGIESKLLEYSKKELIKYSLVHIGSTDWYPNYDGLKWYLEEIFPEIVKREPSAKLYLYGGGNKSDLLVPSNLNNNVEFVGFVPDLWKELENKSLAIVPLRIGGGVRVKILEMLAAGLNVISTSIGKEGIDINDNEHLLIADSKEDMVERTIAFFQGAYDSYNLTINGKEFIKKYHTWEIIAKKFEDEYTQLIES